MKPGTIKIFNKISDSFLYMGKLFVLTEQRELKFIENQKLFNLYLSDSNHILNSYLERILFSNDKLPYYTRYNDSKSSFKKEFNDFWKLFSTKRFEFEIKEEDLTTICKLPNNEALDFVIYAQRAYLANRDGLFECMLNIDGSSVTASSNGFQRVFDSKSININPRAGKVLVSTKTDGLFAGSINSFDTNLSISEKRISDSSLRTGWAEYNFINYNSHTDGNFFLNKTEEKAIEGVNFMVDDGGKKDMMITEIGIDKRNLTELFVGKSKTEKIVFSFNSLTKCFNISDSGKIYYGNLQADFLEDYKPEKLKGLENIRFNLDEIGYPLSAYTVAGGTVYEFFDRVMLIKGGVMYEVSRIECKQIRTFASSKWFQNILMTLSENHFEIHSIHPYG